MASTYFSLIHFKLQLDLDAKKHVDLDWNSNELDEEDWDAKEHDENWDWDSKQLDATKEHDEDWDAKEHDEDWDWDAEELDPKELDAKEHDENWDWDPKELDAKEDDEDWDKLKLYEVDVRFIETFCAYLESWDYTTTDEQRKESLRCMITHLKKIWVQVVEEEEDNNLAENIWPLDIQDFDPLTFGLEGKIQQSKPLIQQWCQILLLGDTDRVHFSEIEQCKSLLDHMIIPSVVTYCVNHLPFGKIVALSDMLSFLLDSFYVVYKCSIYSKELLEYTNFVRAFFYNAACLICLYWAKEANEANEFNIALFDMFAKIKPCAPDVTACYYAVLKTNNLLESDFEEHTPVEFVDFFFGHTILKDGFLILREQLIVLFTFLTDAPHENAAAAAAAAEEDVIRSQIYDLFHEDAYLLLPINVMKEDISNTKMLQNDFMIKIDILNTKIIQLYCTPSDSWNRLEAEKMNYIYFASLQRELFSILKYAPLSDTLMFAQVHPYLMEIRFLRSFFQCLETWDDSDEETWLQLHSVVTSLQRIWGQDYDMGHLSGRLYAIRKEDVADWQHLYLELKEKFHMSKKEINAWLVRLSHCSFHCRSSTSNKILNFLDSILDNMSHLVSSGTCKDDAFKKQIEIVQEKQLLLTNLLKLATNCEYSKYLEEFNMLAQVFANNAACLMYMYWAKEVNDEMTNRMLSNMLQKMKPNTPDVARIYIGALKAICLQPYDYVLLEQTATSFVDYFFEDLVTPWKNDFQILRDEFIFHLTFICHHQSGNAGEIICTQLDVLINDDVYGLLPFDDVNGDLSEKKVGLSDFMKNIATGNAKIRQLYCKFPDPFFYSFPRIIGQGFLDRLIQKLKHLTERMISDGKYVPFAKYEITTIEEELVSLTPIFNQILELKDLNDASLEAVNVVYLAEHVISLCYIFYHLICRYIPYLSDVIDRIKVVKTKLERIEECNMYHNSRSISHSAGLVNALLNQDWNSEMVDFEVDEKILMDNLTRGTKSLDIVSIVGMGGLGKTTLAKKIYGSSSIKSHFNIFAFFSVSQNYNKRRILVDILKDIVGVIDKDSRMTEDDLAHKLKKCLSRQKYFIVFDDIWSINAWEEIRSSFPDDRNGSRVMFTTRHLEVAKRGQIDSSPHHLRFLTEDESLKLLQRKVFHNDMPPPNLSGLVELIAKKCSGLPLAIVVIAGLLARTETSLWFDISKRVSSYLFDEGCIINILELSYKHLPNYLKPCLLYLGAFPVDSSYRVRQVTRLWIVEGFIKESTTKSVKDVATEYLYELFQRSLITVDEMTIGEIHTFRVHDLIYDFCQMKCRDEKFFHLGHEIATSSFRESSIYNHYRVSVGKQSDFNDDAKVSLANTRSLLYFQFDYSERKYTLKKFRFAQVLSLKGIVLEDSNIAHVTCLIDLRHIEAEVDTAVQSIPSSISNLWNMQSLILRNVFDTNSIYLPETLWKMKSLRHVKVGSCKLNSSDGYELNAYPQLENVVSFSRPRISTGKDLEWLLQRLPAVRELDCILDYEFVDSIEERVETFDFHRNLESMKLSTMGEDWPHSINFPSTLIKLKLALFLLPWTAISAFAELRCLRILKLRYVSFPDTTWEMEDVTFPNLKYFELRSSNLELWNASTDSFPCLVQLYFYQTKLKELPPCFAEISSLRKITIWGSSELKSSALWVQEEQRDLGNKLELELYEQ